MELSNMHHDAWLFFCTHPLINTLQPLLVAHAVCAAVLISVAATAGGATLNVLHIVADDLRPELGLYGSPNAVTPNLDSLAATSAVFVNAYCQQPVCSPSRNVSEPLITEETDVCRRPTCFTSTDT